MQCTGVCVCDGAIAAAGVNGSGFPRRASPDLIAELKPYAEHGWNLNNMPLLPGSILQYIGGSVTGVTMPWMYIGMLFSSFCWCVALAPTSGAAAAAARCVSPITAGACAVSQASRGPQFLLNQLRALGRVETMVRKSLRKCLDVSSPRDVVSVRRVVPSRFGVPGDCGQAFEDALRDVRMPVALHLHHRD
jgi:hypothetical protein